MKRNVNLIISPLTDAGIVSICKAFPGDVYVSADKKFVAVAYNQSEITSDRFTLMLGDVVNENITSAGTRIKTTYNINLEKVNEEYPFGKRTFVKKIKEYSDLSKTMSEAEKIAEDIKLLENGNVITITKETHLYEPSELLDGLKVCFGRTEINFIPLKGN